MVTAPIVQKKSDYRVYCAYSDYCAKKDIVALEKVAFLRASISSLVSILTARFNRRSIKETKNPLRAWKRAFFVSFIDLRLKRAVKIEASAKKSNKTNKECFFPRS